MLPATTSPHYFPHQGNSLALMPRASPALNAAASSASIVHVKSYQITHLEPWTMYEAQVVSKNKYGWAEPSEIFSFHTRRTGINDLTSCLS